MRRLVRSALVCSVAVAATVGVATPALAADRPGSRSGATTNSPLSTALTDTISSSTDQDWYRFTTSSSTARSTRVQLLGQPANYRLDVYTATGGLIASGTRSGRAAEEVYRSLSAGTYYVRVMSQDGAYHTSKPYELRFTPLSSGLKVLSHRKYTDSSGYLHIVGEVLNNTTSNRRFVEVDVTFYDSSGRVLGTDFTYVHGDTVLAARKRAPFHVYADAPPGFSTYRLTVTGDATSAAPLGGLTVTPGKRTTDYWGYTTVPGSVKNSSTASARYVEVDVTLYDTYDKVRDTDFTYTQPSTISAGGTAAFETSFASFTNVARVGYLVSGMR